MTLSQLIELWYTKFCIEMIRPRPDFKTFCSLMEHRGWDYDSAMEDYKRKFNTKGS
jgi:hypothetical protein